MKITLHAKQLALLLLILILDHVFQANATSYESHSGDALTTQRQTLRSSMLQLEQPRSSIFSTPSPPLSPSLQIRRSLSKKNRSPPCKKNRSPPPAPRLYDEKHGELEKPKNVKDDEKSSKNM
ncbi:hypothetical protein CTI12_AA048290 [Artemisia annua]|uniref:Uncharacterized protein n=1 Tax=Artemisia annua TaxID=35608 RepID=A0A2U1QC50_ARTAN|nr:hypothetical protein CTI12_AA048290 [Artemisia annua]